MRLKLQNGIKVRVEESQGDEGWRMKGRRERDEEREMRIDKSLGQTG